MVTTITGHHAKIRFFFDIAVSSKQKKSTDAKGALLHQQFSCRNSPVGPHPHYVDALWQRADVQRC